MKKRFIYLLIAGAIIVLAVVLFVLYNKGIIRPMAAGEVVNLRLEPSSGEYKINDVFDVSIVLNTGIAESAGVQIHYLNYNPNVLEVQDADPNVNGTQIQTNKLFDTPLGNSVDKASGKIDFAEGALTGAPFRGSNVVAKITFKAIAAGNSLLNFDFTSGANTQTFVGDTTTGTNILTSVSGATINVKEQPVLPSVNLRVNGQKEVTIKAGSNITLNWSSANATSCLGSGGWTDSKPLSGEARLGPFNEPKSYKLICSNSAGSAFDTVVVHIEGQPAPVLPAVDLKVNNADGPITINYNADATLSWNSRNAANCVASNGWSGDKATAGEETTGNLTDSKTYTLTCYKDDASAVDSITVNVSGRPQANPGPSDSGQVSQSEPTSPSTEEENQAVTQAPTPPAVPTQPSTQTTEIYKGGVIRPWTLWFFYALIPLSLTAGIVWFYLRQKRAKKIKSSVSDLSNMPNPPGDWPK